MSGLHTPPPAALVARLAPLRSRDDLVQLLHQIMQRAYLPPDLLDHAIREARQQHHWRKVDEAQAEYDTLTLVARTGEPLPDAAARWQRKLALSDAMDRHYAAADRLWSHRT